jgi:hypothetical protein
MLNLIAASVLLTPETHAMTDRIFKVVESTIPNSLPFPAVVSDSEINYEHRHRRSFVPLPGYPACQRTTSRRLGT